MKKTCDCCGKEINAFGIQKYCSACSIYTDRLRHQIGTLKFQLKELRIKHYGSMDGSQRIR